MARSQGQKALHLIRLKMKSDLFNEFNSTAKSLMVKRQGY